MKPLTRKTEPRRLWHVGKDGERVEGARPGLWGECSGLWGECSGLWGNCTGLSGNCSDIPESARPCNIADWVE